MSSRKVAKSIKSFEFSTLYIKLPHDKLQTMLRRFIDFCFDGRENNFILPNYFGTRWMKEKIKMVSSGLVNKIYKRCCQLRFFQVLLYGEQKICSDCSILCQPFLHYYESKCMKHLQEKELIEVENFLMSSALSMIWMQSMMLKYLKVSSGIYT